MDQEMNFPNPVERTDLPVRRRRWPKVLLAGAVLLGLVVAFLPQLLSNKVGRKFVVSYISSKTNSPGVTIESFRTSWRGPTEIRFLSIPDTMGRRIGFKSLTCQAGLLDLIRGRFKLGEATVEGLNVDWVVDDGKGGDTWDRFKGVPGAPLPQVSGKITVNSGTVTLYRGSIQKKVYTTTWTQATLQNIEGTLEIAALDRPWTFNFAADTVEEGVEARGTVAASGTMALAAGASTPSRMDLAIKGEKVRPGPLGAALVPGATAEDVREALGPVVDSFDLAIKGDAGRLAFEKFDLTGSTGARVHAKPVVDLSATPPTLTLAEPGEIAVANCKRLGALGLVYVNPFLRESMGSTADGKAAGGWVGMKVERLSVPLTRQWAKGLAANGWLTVQGLTLSRGDEIGAEQSMPEGLASQLAMLTGDTADRSRMDADGAFVAADGGVSVSGMRTTIGDTTMRLDGSTEIDAGALKLWATVEESASVSSLFQGAAPAAGGGVKISIGGTVLRPQLGVVSLAESLAGSPAGEALKDRLGRQTQRMRSREADRMWKASQTRVEEILRPLKEPEGKK